LRKGAPLIVSATWRVRSTLIAVVAIALLLNIWALSLNGLGNQYYTAAARSMAESWHNWFFVALDRGGFISVDKPPIPLWVAGLSARLFGVNTWSILLPTAFAGAGAVALLWVTVRRQFGVVAATVAALVLAVSPVNVAVNRLNLPEPWLVLFLVAAVWALQRALEGRHSLRWCMMAGAFVGLAFNTKMLAAYIVVPALGLAVLLASRTWRDRIVRNFVFGAAAIATSVPWILVVDAIPAASRPYVGGSTDNSVTDLIFGYNGLGRVEGNGGGVLGGASSGPGGIFGGPPSALRLFSGALGGQIAWLLPLAAVGAVAAFWLHRRQPVRRAVVALWVGWMLLVAVVFSNAEGTFHAYYTALLGPAVAALVGIGAASFVPLLRVERIWWIAVSAAVAGTVALQIRLSGRAPHFYGWTRVVLLIGVVGAVALAAVAMTRRAPQGPLLIAGAVLLAALLVAPIAWAVSETSNAVLNATLPQAGPRQGLAGRSFGSESSNGNPELAAFLLTHDDGERWQLVTSTAQQASGLIADQGLSVMAIGGFMGTDPSISVHAMGTLIADGAVRYFLTTGGGGAGSAGRVEQGLGAGPVMTAVRRSCERVVDPALPAAFRTSIFDCLGKSAAFTTRAVAES
jgi:4-amino-4-deoxy-L-arabinose transferase-like glycosyltransferase